MLVELYIFFQIIMLGLFFTAFYTRNEIIWTLCLVMAGMLVFDSYNIQQTVYFFNTSANVYQVTTVVYQYPWLLGINLIFVGLSLVLGIQDIWQKYVIESEVVNNVDQKILP